MFRLGFPLALGNRLHEVEQVDGLALGLECKSLHGLAEIAEQLLDAAEQRLAHRPQRRRAGDQALQPLDHRVGFQHDGQLGLPPRLERLVEGAEITQHALDRVDVQQGQDARRLLRFLDTVQDVRHVHQPAAENGEQPLALAQQFGRKRAQRGHPPLIEHRKRTKAAEPLLYPLERARHGSGRRAIAVAMTADGDVAARQQPRHRSQRPAERRGTPSGQTGQPRIGGELDIADGDELAQPVRCSCRASDPASHRSRAYCRGRARAAGAAIRRRGCSLGTNAPVLAGVANSGMSGTQSGRLASL